MGSIEYSEPPDQRKIDAVFDDEIVKEAMKEMMENFACIFEEEECNRDEILALLINYLTPVVIRVLNDEIKVEMTGWGGAESEASEGEGMVSKPGETESEKGKFLGLKNIGLLEENLEHLVRIVKIVAVKVASSRGERYVELALGEGYVWDRRVNLRKVFAPRDPWHFN